MKLIRHNGELVCYGRNSAMRAMLAGPEKGRLQIWVEKVVRFYDTIRKSNSKFRDLRRQEIARESRGELSEFWTL